MELQVDTGQVRVWIYRSIIELNESEERDIQQQAQSFINEWASHGTKLKADFEIVHHHYLVFIVDEQSAKASGCSIDSSVAFVRQLENKYNLGLFNRMEIGFLKDDEVVFHHYNDLKEAYDRGDIVDSDLVFDAMIQLYSDFKEGFLKPFFQSSYYLSLK